MAKKPTTRKAVGAAGAIVKRARKSQPATSPQRIDDTLNQAEKLSLASAVAARVQIRSLHLVEMAGKRELLDKELPTELSFTVTTEATADQDKGEIFVAVKFELVGAYSNHPAKAPGLQIRAVFHLLYGIKSFDGLTKGHIDAFGDLNGVYNAWPFWREYVQSTTSRMGLPPLTIPVFRPRTVNLPLAPGKESQLPIR